MDLVEGYDRPAASYTASMPLVVKDVVVMAGMGGIAALQRHGDRDLWPVRGG